MKSKRFLTAVEHTLEHEGGYNDIKEDKGGATSWGISLRFLKTIKRDINCDGAVDWLDIKALSREDAVNLYHLEFWRPHYDMLPARLGLKVFDTAVNAGHTRAHVLLQKALNSLGSRLKVDGLIGRVTLQECAKYVESRILAAYVSEQKAYYRALVLEDPSQEKFIKGWTNRANWLPEVK